MGDTVASASPVSSVAPSAKPASPKPDGIQVATTFVPLPAPDSAPSPLPNPLTPPCPVPPQPISGNVLNGALSMTRTPAPINAATPLPEAGTARRTIVFLLDKSGSMYETAGASRRIDLATRELCDLIQQLDPRLQFDIVLYAEKTVVFRSEAIPAGPDAKLEAIRFLQQDAPCGGGTNFAAGYQAALALRPDTILVLTDGEFNALDQTLLTQVHRLREKSGSNVTLNALGFFPRPETNASRLLTRLCADSHGQLLLWKPDRNERVALLK